MRVTVVTAFALTVPDPTALPNAYDSAQKIGQASILMWIISSSQQSQQVAMNCREAQDVAQAVYRGGLTATPKSDPIPFFL
jgi:hypothetical protein